MQCYSDKQRYSKFPFIKTPVRVFSELHNRIFVVTTEGRLGTPVPAGGGVEPDTPIHYLSIQFHSHLHFKSKTQTHKNEFWSKQFLFLFFQICLLALLGKDKTHS